MPWIDIACIIVAATTANHLELIEAVEDFIGRRLPVVNCSKCLTFWLTLVYCCLVCCDNIAALLHSLPSLLAVSFLASYLAIWTELLMACTDTIYNRIYEKIINLKTDTEGPGEEHGDGGQDS